MLKTSIIIVLLFSLQCFGLDTSSSTTEASKSSSSTYSTKYDNVDIKEIISSDRLLKNYVNCLLDKGPCTPDGDELKKNLPDAINNNCAKCSEKQKHGSEEVMHYLIDNKPEWWDELEKKYKSDGSYKREYLKKKMEEEKKDHHKSDENSKEDNKKEPEDTPKKQQ